MDFGGGGYFVIFFFVPNCQVLLGDACTGFEPECATLLGGQKWPFLAQNSVFQLLGPLEPPKIALRGPILLAHGNSGHKLPKIRRGWFLG